MRRETSSFFALAYCTAVDTSVVWLRRWELNATLTNGEIDQSLYCQPKSSSITLKSLRTIIGPSFRKRTPNLRLRSHRQPLHQAAALDLSARVTHVGLVENSRHRTAPVPIALHHQLVELLPANGLTNLLDLVTQLIEGKFQDVSGLAVEAIGILTQISMEVVAGVMPHRSVPG